MPALCVLLICLATASIRAQPTYAPGQILVKFRTAASKPTAGALQAIAQRYGVTDIQPMVPLRSAKPAAPNPFANLYRLYLTGDPVQAAAAYAADPAVLYAQPNYLYTLSAAPNDPLYPNQSNLTQIGWQTLRDALGPQKKQIVVAIIDSGIDSTHEDLQANLWHNVAETNGRPGVDDDGNGYIDDVIGWDFTDAPELPGTGDYTGPDNDPKDESSHGTQVAGVVAAVTNNSKGIAGTAPEARLMVLRAGANLQSGGTFLEADDLAAAVLYAADNGANVINMSWGGPEQSLMIRDALRYAAQKGVALVAAAGNSAAPDLEYPAGYNQTIAVGAVDGLDRQASFSTFGVGLDLVAPGINVLGTQPGNIYAARSGTSFSAPQVSGVIALILSRYPDQSPEQMRSMLVRTARDLGLPGPDNNFGAGRLDAGALVAQLGVDQPIVQILAPNNDTAADTVVDIVARASGSSVAAYRLSVGQGRQPQTWARLASGGAQDSIHQAWNVTALADTVAVVRLEADLTDGHTIEDRVQIFIRKAPPVISALTYGPVLDGAKRTYDFRWHTDQRAEGGIAYKPFGAAHFDSLFTAQADTVHIIDLPDNLAPGPLAFRMLARGQDGRIGAGDETTLSYEPFRVPESGFAETGVLPDGFLPDRTADFNANGRPDIALMPYTEGAAFSRVHIYERAPGGDFTDLFQTADAALPWAVGDLTGDGRPDLLTAQVLRITVYASDAGSPFPTHNILDKSQMWGGDIADLDGDGQNEIVARSGGRRGIQIFKRGTDGVLTEGAFLPDPFSGFGDLSPRFVTGDFDGDGQSEILSGDADGNLWIYEYRNGSYALTWQRAGSGDVRWIGGGADLDGDGKIEFAAARAVTDDDDPLNGYWTLEIYSSDGPDSYRLEWSDRITGVILTGNGIATGDLDGDGRPDLAVCLRPDLYIYRADAPDQYRPVWHTDVGLTYRPLIADLDGNGKPDLLFNRDGAIRIVERDAPAFTVAAPQILRARALGPQSAQIDWMQTPKALAYRIYRSQTDAPFTLHATIAGQTTFTDTALVENQPYRYQIAAVLADSSEQRSDSATVTPHRPPQVAKFAVLDANRLAVWFTAPMNDALNDAANFAVSPQPGRPSTAVRDQADRRTVLTFPGPFDAATHYTLTIANVADSTGTPLDSRYGQVPFTLASATADWLVRADADKSGRIDFPDFLYFAAAFNTTDATFDFNEDGIVNFSDFIVFASLFGRSVA